MRAFPRVLLDSLVQEAAASSRRRVHWNLHSEYDDPCQRLFNAIDAGSYIRPHRHSIDPKNETLIAVRGRFALLLFDERGSVENIVRFSAAGAVQGSEPFGVEVAPIEWHTVLALEAGSVLLELKAGPYDPNAAKEFAPWSPEEGSDEAHAFRESLRTLVDSSRAATDER